MTNAYILTEIYWWTRMTYHSLLISNRFWLIYLWTNYVRLIIIDIISRIGILLLHILSVHLYYFQVCFMKIRIPCNILLHMLYFKEFIKFCRHHHTAQHSVCKIVIKSNYYLVSSQMVETRHRHTPSQFPVNDPWWSGKEQ